MVRGAKIWTVIPSQINAALTSVIYLARNSRMRHYYHKLLTCESTKINSKQHLPPAPKTTR